MRQSLVGLSAVVLASFASSCSDPSPSSESITSPVVLTLPAKNVDFGKYQTFFLRPEIRELSDDGTATVLDAKTAQGLLDTTKQNMTARGYRSVDQQSDADLAVEMMYLKSISSSVTCYSWWDPYYWGYPAYSYYPYYGSCDSTVWKSQLLATVMVDVSNARSTPGVNPNAVTGDAGTITTAQQVGGVWFSGVYGVDLNSAEAQNAINEAFGQSPYLAAAKR